MSSVLVDTGVWYAFFDRRDAERRRRGDDDVGALYDLLAPHRLVLPWPIAYETLCTAFVRNAVAVVQFEAFLKSRPIDFLDDAAYRRQAFEDSLASARGHPKLSLVDSLVRLILADPANRIDYLATYNFGDFADVCQARRIEIIPDG